MDFVDLYQFGQIKRANRSVGNVAQEVHYQRQAQRDEVDLLNERIDRLTMLCEAMWVVVSESLELTEDELVQRLVAIDAADGSQDGRRSKTPTQCECGAMVNARLTKCQFCGTPAPIRSAFDVV